MKTLRFEITIHAPRLRVWDAMLSAEGYPKALARLKALCEQPSARR